MNTCIFLLYCLSLRVKFFLWRSLHRHGHHRLCKTSQLRFPAGACEWSSFSAAALFKSTCISHTTPTPFKAQDQRCTSISLFEAFAVVCSIRFQVIGLQDWETHVGIHKCLNLWIFHEGNSIHTSVCVLVPMCDSVTQGTTLDGNDWGGEEEFESPQSVPFKDEKDWHLIPP